LKSINQNQVEILNKKRKYYDNTNTSIKNSINNFTKSITQRLISHVPNIKEYLSNLYTSDKQLNIPQYNALKDTIIAFSTSTLLYKTIIECLIISQHSILSKYLFIQHENLSYSYNLTDDVQKEFYNYYSAIVNDGIVKVKDILYK